MIPRIQLMAIFALDIIRSIWMNSNLNFCYLPTYCKAYYTYCSWNSMNGKGEYVSVALHIRHFFVCLPPTCPAYPIPPTALPLVYFVKTIHHRQTNSSIVKGKKCSSKPSDTRRLEKKQKKQKKSFRLNCKRQNRTTTTRGVWDLTFRFLGVVESWRWISSWWWRSRETGWWCRWRRCDQRGRGCCWCCSWGGAPAAIATTTRRTATIAGTRHIGLHVIQHVDDTIVGIAIPKSFGERVAGNLQLSNLPNSL